VSCEKVFKEQLKARGFRLTPQREEILEALHQTAGCTTTAEALYERVAGRDPGVDLVTVYRTLELLGNMGFVKCIETGHKERLWEFVGAEHPHPHLLCRVCGELSGLDEDEMAPLRQYLEEHYGFSAAIGQVTIPGLCRRCRESGPQPN
jgi:Fur family transcriptional regulator, ferric uptake regulator